MKEAFKQCVCVCTVHCWKLASLNYVFIPSGFPPGLGNSTKQCFNHQLAPLTCCDCSLSAADRPGNKKSWLMSTVYGTFHLSHYHYLHREEEYVVPSRVSVTAVSNSMCLSKATTPQMLENNGQYSVDN